MRYLRVEWVHSDPDDPVTLYSELDDEGWEVRKVEFFRDGRAGFASESETAGGTELGEKPVPPLEEIAADSQFRPASITREEFEKVWANRWRPTGKARTR
jgi:Domain of unknown function (DUF6881)